MSITYTPCEYCGDSLPTHLCALAKAKGTRPSRTARIKSLMQDSGYSRKEAEAWVDFEGDYKANASAR